MQFWKKLRRKPTESLDYARFWKWFQKHQKTFHTVIKNEADIEAVFFYQLSTKLDELKEGFFFLCGMIDKNTAELIFSAEGNLRNIVFIEELVAAAPCMEGWLFTALKPVTPLQDINIEMSGFSFNATNIHFFSTAHHDLPDEIDITLVHDDLTEDNLTAITNGSYIFLDMCLGELNATTIIDSLEVVGRSEVKQDLIPIEKLESYLIWREKEFMDKHESIQWLSERDGDTYGLFEGKKQEEEVWLAMMNTDVLNWEGKTSYPWILEVAIEYQGEEFNGFPNEATYQALDKVEDQLILKLPEIEGHIYIGRQTGQNVRTIFLACKDFRKSSKVLFFFQRNHQDFPIEFEFYKDKYWQRLRQFQGV